MVWQIVGMLAVVTAIGVSIALHEVGSNNPDGVEIKKNKDLPTKYPSQERGTGFLL